MTDTAEPEPSGRDPNQRPDIRREPSRDADDRQDLPVGELDDQHDRDELRDRFAVLLQELRVLLPGVQLLAAFLFTVPFAQRFERVDHFGRAIFGVALVAAMLSVVAYIAPIAFHRFGTRTARVQRLRVSIWCARGGLFLMGVSMVLAQAVVSRFLFGPVVTVALIIVTAVAMAGMWILMPLSARYSDRENSDR